MLTNLHTKFEVYIYIPLNAGRVPKSRDSDHAIWGGLERVR